MRHAQGSAPVPNHVVLRIANEAVADQKTVRNVIYGKPVRGKVKDRVTKSLGRRGIVPMPNDTETRRST